MDRLNKSGRVLMEYRYEFLKHYSDSIDEALKEAVSSMYNDKKIDEKIFRSIFDESITNEEFERILAKSKQFTKSKAELNYEFDQIRKKINEYMISIGFVDSMNTKNSIDMNKIIIIHQFDLDRSYLMNSFGVNQTEIIPLMKRRGFIEKFAVLRLNQVLKEIYTELRVPEDIDHGYSLVYYNKATRGFSIDYKYYINVNLAANEEKMKMLINKIRELDKVVDRKFRNKLGHQYFTKNNNKKALEVKDKAKPVSKQFNIDSPQDIVQRTKDVQIDNKKGTSNVSVEDNNKTPQKGKNDPQTQNNKIPNKNTDVEKKRELPGNIPIKKSNEEIQNEKKETPTTQQNVIVKEKPTINNNPTEPTIEEFEIEFDISDKDLL
jgi:hypothetical protein